MFCLNLMFVGVGQMNQKRKKEYDCYYKYLTVKPFDDKHSDINLISGPTSFAESIAKFVNL